ncbi:TIGR00341 family protein [Defluviimonas sp. D31]|uniref:TIGR00341 family protein n=1 Tax=Defluviimonas sp. D31 TaxID=3083253 RepID=UPI00296F55B8|nr:TIGR00341 family protein [Defluviimonas sp. D31]MDW4550461.1 TIGR00341 family protein [Defluviimonas sp. D31]
MSLRQIHVSAPEASVSRLLAAAEDHGAIAVRVFAEAQAPGRKLVQMLVGRGHRQDLIDALQSALGPAGDWRITLTPVETTIPFPDDDDEEEDKEDEKPSGPGGRTREEIYNEVWTAAEWGRDYIVFVILSTIVAVFGMLADNVAVVVGAMVIAPLLGPNLAFAVGVALGDGKLMARAAGANLLGIALVLALSTAVGWFWHLPISSSELMARSNVGFDGMAIALASGAAAALSLVTGVSSALVGVMVAVALLPPTAAIGLFLGAARPDLAAGAALLLGVNVVCVNLAAQIVMVTRGITPRTWFEKQKARRASRRNAALWAILLVALALLLWLRGPLSG